MTQDDPKKTADEPDIVLTDAVPTGETQQGPPISAGHSRFYCEKCHTVSSFEANIRVISNLLSFLSLDRAHSYHNQLHNISSSLTIYHNMPLLGDVPDARRSIRQPPGNVPCAPFCNWATVYYPFICPSHKSQSRQYS